MTKPGAQLISWYLNPDRLLVARRWSRRHADTQRRLCERFAAPVIGTVTCQDIKTEQIQAIVNAAPTAGEGDRVRRMVSAMVSAGLDSGYFANPRLAKVHWQLGDRQLALERSQRLGHMTGASWFFVSLARHAREGSGELAEWLNEAETVTGFNYAAGSAGIRSRFPHPNGAGTWAEDDRQVRFPLKDDTGSEDLSVLAGKLDGYQALAGAMAWNDQMCPVVLFCFTSPRREQSARRALAAAREAPALRIATAAIDPRTTIPAGPVWLPLPTRTGHQVRLADLDDAIPDPWLAYRQEQARKRRGVAECDRMYRDGQDDDEDPIPEGPAPHVSGEVNRQYGGPDCRAPGRTAS